MERLVDLHVDHELLEAGTDGDEEVLLQIQVSGKRNLRCLLGGWKEEATGSHSHTGTLRLLLEDEIEG